MEKDVALLEKDKASTHSASSIIDEKGGVGLADIDVLGADIQAIPEDLLEAAEYAKTMTAEEIEDTIQRIVDEVPIARRYLFDETLRQDPIEYQQVYEELKVEAAMIIINSPYAEVRAVVDNHDDPSISGATFRTLVIGTIFVGAGGFINQFFSIRQPTITVYSNCAQVLAFPAAKLMELLPTTTYTTFGYTWSLNPGKFNPKEHMLITIMANVGFNTPYTMGNKLWVSDHDCAFDEFYWVWIGWLTRRFLVYPAHAIWCRAFHAEKETVANGWRISKMRWFLYCFCGMFVYFWFPDFIFQALSYFNWMTWIAPNNVHLAAITGSIGGLGLNPIPTFDWVQLTVFSTLNSFIGAFITLPMIAALWYTNTWNTAYLPINSNRVFDNTGNFYNVSNAVGSNTLFNQTLYENYSPAYLAAGNILIYGVFFAVYTATLTHAFLYHRHEIAHGFKSILSRKKTSEVHKDVHVRLMMAYTEVPEWQYLVILIAAIALGAAGIGAYPTETSPAVVLYGVFLAAIFVIPAITNVQITLNVLAELFGGLWFPGNAVAMNYFKSYGYVTTAHTLNFAQDLKLAHYMHIPPAEQVHTFWAQIYATIVSSFVCIAILNFQMTKIDGGTLGPKRMFGAGGIYNSLLYCFLIGALIPIPFYILRKRVKSFEYVHLPVIIAGGLSWAPYNLANLWPAVPVAWVFNVFIKKRYLAWWSKYNYITTTAFSASIAICAVVIFFGVEWTNVSIDWIGNNRPFEGCDADGCPRLPIPDKGFFGPGPGEFH
ncbi:OPT-domain-containing protein [Favolaschia claudopus]|uniref:OPT-domain-containing protein n=1 Tax=Favolaschia claudopus TaxID=2862362 RepID=A0AAV9ZKX4_9AGAR